MNKIPAFYHVPKCGGTYLLNMMRAWCTRKEKIDNISIKTISIKKDVDIAYRLYSTFDANSRDIICNLSEYAQLKKKTSDKIFSIIVEPSGDWTNFIQDLSLQNYDLAHFTVLREPFSRIRSLFNYLNQDESVHEKAHKTIETDFKEFLESYQYEDSFVIRKFIQLNEQQPINQDIYKQILQYFQSIDIQVGNMTNIMDTFNKVLTLCDMFNIDEKTIKNNYFIDNQKSIRNKTDYIEHRELQDFPQTTIEFFTERTKYDRMLYDNYVNIS